MILSKRPLRWISKINWLKLPFTADSVTTMMIVAIRGGPRPYKMQSTLASLHRANIFSAKPTNGVITTVVPASGSSAGIIKDKLLPAPVGNTTINGLTPSITASTACSCLLVRNFPVGPYNFWMALFIFSLVLSSSF